MCSRFCRLFNSSLADSCIVILLTWGNDWISVGYIGGHCALFESCFRQLFECCKQLSSHLLENRFGESARLNKHVEEMDFDLENARISFIHFVVY